MNKVTNNIKKLIKSLDAVKYRRLNGCFKAEGTKCVMDTINNFEVSFIVATEAWYSSHYDFISKDILCYETSVDDMPRLTSLSTAADVIAVYKIPNPGEFLMKDNELVLALDAIQDPGNLGTIVRVADWFGVTKILCGIGTADIYSPKAVMATMGAISRVKLYYCDLIEQLEKLKGKSVIYGTMLDGEDVFKSELTPGGIIIMGNEGRGVSNEIQRLFDKVLTIPSYPGQYVSSESLNVAMATGIIISQFRSRIL